MSAAKGLQCLHQKSCLHTKVPCFRSTSLAHRYRCSRLPKSQNSSSRSCGRGTKRQRSALHAQRRTYTLASDADDEDGDEDDTFVDEEEEEGLSVPGFGVDDEEEDPVAALRPGIRSTAAADDVDADLPGPGLDDDLDIVADEEEEDNLLPERKRGVPRMLLGADEDDEGLEEEEEEEPEEDIEDELEALAPPNLDAPGLDAGLGLDAIITEAASSSAAQPRVPGVRERGRISIGDLEDDDEEEGDELAGDELEDLPGPSYPDPPVREYALAELMEMAGFSLVERGAADVRITGIQVDADMVQPGDLFAYPAPENFAEALSVAVENGAVAALVMEGFSSDEQPSVPLIPFADPRDALHRLAAAFYNDPSRRMTVVGVSGSSGKTTTAWLVRGIFEEWGRLCGMAGSIENALYADKLDHQGNLWAPAEPDPTLDRDCSAAFHLTPYQGKYEAPKHAPDGLEMQQLLAGMADRDADVAVVECDAFGLDQGRMDQVDVDIAVFTNLASDPAEAGGTPEQLLAAWGAVFRRLTNPSRQRAIINLDDPYADDMRAFAAQVPVVTYAMYNRDADVWPDKMRFSLWETEVVVQTPVGALQIITPLIGRHNVYNILAAVAVGLAVTVNGEPIPLKTIVQGIEATEIVPGRCEIIDEDQPFGCVVDAADSPAALSRLLDGVRECSPRRIILVLGCPGGRDQGKRPFMGEIAHYKADMVIMTNDSPWGEAPNEIIADMVAGYPDSILRRNAAVPYQPGFLQDPGRADFNALEFLWQNCYEYRRYVVEDRWTAIRWAIGSAQADDCVVIAGRGHKDCVEWLLLGNLVRGWFDDRVEARNALAKVGKLWQISGFDRAELPWMDTGDREGRMFEPV